MKAPLLSVDRAPGIEGAWGYTGAAENTLWVHTLVGGHLLQGPNRGISWRGCGLIL